MRYIYFFFAHFIFLISQIDSIGGTVNFSNFASTLEIQVEGVPLDGFVVVGTSSTLQEFGFTLDEFSLISALKSDFKQFGDKADFGGESAFGIKGFFLGVGSGDGGSDDFSGKNILLVGGDGSGLDDSDYLFLINTDKKFETDAPPFAASVDLNTGLVLLGSRWGASKCWYRRSLSNA